MGGCPWCVCNRAFELLYGRDGWQEHPPQHRWPDGLSFAAQEVKDELETIVCEGKLKACPEHYDRYLGVLKIHEGIRQIAIKLYHAKRFDECATLLLGMAGAEAIRAQLEREQ